MFASVNRIRHLLTPVECEARCIIVDTTDAVVLADQLSRCDACGALPCVRLKMAVPVVFRNDLDESMYHRMNAGETESLFNAKRSGSLSSQESESFDYLIEACAVNDHVILAAVDIAKARYQQ